jgi:lipoprotein-releasing system ATP-binding protein
MILPMSRKGASQMTSHLHAQGLKKAYRKGRSLEVPVLHGVDFSIEPGELVSIVGASGSGKSTLLHLLGLLDGPDGGTIHLNGERIDNLPDKRRDQLRNEAFGFVFQSYHLMPELTAIENVLMPHLIRLSPWQWFSKKAELKREATMWLERVGLDHRARHKPSELSGGEMQRTAIARALAGSPQLILADEPTGNLDAESGESVMKLLRDLNRERGMTMIVVTHDMNVARQTDRVVRLNQGLVEVFNPTLAA